MKYHILGISLKILSRKWTAWSNIWKYRTHIIVDCVFLVKKVLWRMKILANLLLSYLTEIVDTLEEIYDPMDIFWWKFLCDKSVGCVKKEDFYIIWQTEKSFEDTYRWEIFLLSSMSKSFFKAFSGNNCLKSHLWMHIDEIPYPWYQCENSFSQMGSLK